MEQKRLMQKLNKTVNEIVMPKEMQERIIRNCYVEMEEKIMSDNTPKKYFKKSVIVAASLLLCISLSGITALAATGKLQGFFKDITGWNGAVIGTTYEQATEEIELRVIEDKNTLVVEVTMLNPQTAPYNSFEVLGVESYKVVDENGAVVLEGTTTEMTKVIDGKAKVAIPLENIPNGEYKLVVSQLVGSAKADQPLVLSGTWECEFKH